MFSNLITDKFGVFLMISILGSAYLAFIPMHFEDIFEYESWIYYVISGAMVLSLISSLFSQLLYRKTL